jgi:coproporphyrinogen III oxidase-like Fe-S oxidoreductase
MLERDLDIILERGLDQVTWYPLMVSESTRRVVTRTLGEVNFSREKRFYGIILRHLLGHYDFSSAWCFSKKKSIIDEYIVDYDEYAGLGSGSIGYMDGRCYANAFDIPRYIRTLDQGGFPLMASRAFSLPDRVRYDFIMKLFGMKVEEAFLREKYNRPVRSLIWKDILAFTLSGGIRFRKGVFELTERGTYYWVVIMREFFTAVNNFRSFCLKAAETGPGEREIRGPGEDR